MIKILHFVSTPARWSGVMGTIMNYYRHIDRSKIQFDFLCFLPCEESFEAEINSMGGSVFFVSRPMCRQGIMEIAGFLKIHAREYTWFHNHEVYLSFFLKLLTTHYGLDNFIVHCHATQYSDRPLAALRNQLACLPIPYMNCTRFACSMAAGKFLFEKSQAGNHDFLVIPNAVECKRFLYNSKTRSQYRKALHLESSFIILHIGRFSPQKNHLFLLELFYDIEQLVPAARLLLAGDGYLKEVVEKRAYELGISNKVLFLGQRDDIPALLQAADLFVLPSLYEGLPISCMEAQAAGLPCLISDTITDEVCLNEKVQRLSLKNRKAWVEKCIECYSGFSIDTCKENRCCPETLPDITCEAAKLADFYEMRNS